MATKKTEAETEDSEGEESEEGAKKGKSKLIMIIGAVVLLLAVGGGLMASGVLGGGDKKEEEAATEETADAKGGKGVAKPVYYELPEFLVNLSSSTARVSFLKMSVTLELRDQEAVALVEANKPRIVDTFNTYLREMRPTDLNGSAGIYRLRDELMTRLNKTIEEGLVKDILFSEIIVQ
ncbi:MAG: flagellar basal body-associated FliL family protein [Rickettsiales bacterium]